MLGKDSIKKLIMTYSLGLLPWDFQELEQKYFTNFSEVWRSIHEHPGYIQNREIELLKMTFQIFEQSVNDFNLHLSEFHNVSHFKGGFERQNEGLLDQTEIQVRKSIFCIASSAMALVDHGRRLSKPYEIKQYNTRIEKDFAKNNAHQFIQGLRNQLLHVQFIEPQWQLSESLEEGKKTQFILKSEDLLSCSNWKPLAKEYIELHPSGICLETLLSEYYKKVKEFNKWFCSELLSHNNETITDYLRYENYLKAIDSRAWWNIILKQFVIASGRDPYIFLERLLKKSELDKALRFPHRSKKQVDYIIDCLDEYGACNKELRTTVYNAFNVKIS